MAILTINELDKLRQEFHRWRIQNGLSGREGRTCLNNTLQAIEDWYQAHKVDGSGRINTASTPYGITYTANEKRQLFQFWMELKKKTNSA